MPRFAPNIVPRTIGIGSVTASALQTSGTTITFNHTVEAQNNRLLVVLVQMNDSSSGSKALTGITYNGVALTHSVDQRFDGGNLVEIVHEIWFLKDPAIGTNSLVVTASESFTTSEQGAAVAITMWNTNSSPITATGLNDSAGNQVGSIFNIGLSDIPNCIALALVGTNNEPGHVAGSSDQIIVADTVFGGLNDAEMSVSYRRMGLVVGTADMTVSWTGLQEAGSTTATVRPM